MKNAVSGLGLAPDAAMVTFPIDMFLPGSDISPLEPRRREFYNALTKWKSAFEQARDRHLGAAIENAPTDQSKIKAWIAEIYEKYKPKAVVAAERLGAGKNGIVHSATRLCHAAYSVSPGRCLRP